MADSIAQVDRRVAFKSPLGDDVLALQSFQGNEELGRLFSYSVELVSEDHKINFDAVIGKNVTLRVDVDDENERYFNGFVSDFTQIEPRGQLARYHATVVPWLWFLTRVSDCRIFQEKSVPDIIKEVFESRGFSDFDIQLNGSYNPREYCVQYRETDFNFISRLMEEEGIYYFYEHEDGAHKVVLVDSASTHQDCPFAAKVDYYPWAEDITLLGIRNWIKKSQVVSGAFAHTDYNFKTPDASLLADKQEAKPNDLADFEIYDAYGEYEKRSDGQALAEVRLQELQARHKFYHGEADIRGLVLGCNFELSGYFREDDNQKYLITSISHSIRSNPYETEDVSESEFYKANLTAIPADVSFRPQRITRQPIVSGPQTAVVTGPSGEEIYTDEYGRVKVHFFWDRHDNQDDKSSCWIRVSQYWAGKKWGAMHIPRIGQEVVVEYIEGDPDRPLITGRVYNNDQMPPYDLPANKTQSGIKSRSSKGGSPDNFNEIRFEDKKGEEQVYIHAEKNQDNHVENNETTFVGNDRTEDVIHDETITIGNDRTEKVGNDETITIGNNRTEDVGANEIINIADNRTERVGKNEAILVQGNRSHTVQKDELKVVGKDRDHGIGGNEKITIGKDQKTLVVGKQTNLIRKDQKNTVSKNQTTTIIGNQTLTVNKKQSNTIKAQQITAVKSDCSLSVDQSYTADVKKKVTITAGDQITLKTGKSMIVMKKNGEILIKGKDIKVIGSGKLFMKAAKNMVMKAKKILEN